MADGIAKKGTTRAVVLDTGYTTYDQEEQILEAAGYVLERFPGDRHDRDGKIAFAQGAQGVLLRWTLVDDDFLERLSCVKAIVRYGVGYDNVNVDACTRHGVRVSNVQGYANHSVSDHALALMFACARNLKQGLALFRERFAAPPREANFDLHDKTLGIVGLGNIGGTLAVKAQTLFSRKLATDPYIPDDRFRKLNVERTKLDALLEQSDVISLHCNLTEETNHLMNTEAFDKMKSTAILVNTSRGPVVEPMALLSALNMEKIHSAGVDVFPDEPPKEDWNDLLTHPNLFATGHYAWHSVSASRELQRRAAENLAAMLIGESPPDCLNAG